MVHFLAGLIISCILVGNAWSKCDDSKLIMQRSTSFGISWGENSGSSMFGSELTVNIPLVINGKQACYHQSSAINIKTEKVKENEFVEYEVTPMEADFENVPNPATYQFINVDYDADNKASNVQIISFLCSGETPIGGDAFGDSLTKLSQDSAEESVSVDVFIATGHAADNLSISQAKKAKAKVFDRFLEIYESRTDGDILYEDENTNIYIPSVLTGISVNSLERKLYSAFFSRTNSSINGCSKRFVTKMQDLLLHNVVKENPFKDIELKKKFLTSKLKLKWTL